MRLTRVVGSAGGQHWVPVTSCSCPVEPAEGTGGETDCESLQGGDHSCSWLQWGIAISFTRQPDEVLSGVPGACLVFSPMTRVSF